MKGKGLLFALLAALVSGVSVFVNSYGVKDFDPFTYTTLKNAAVALGLAAAFLAFNQRQELRRVSRSDALLLLAIALTGGSAAFLLFFQGLSLATGASSSFIYRSLFIFAAALGAFFFREKLSPAVAAGGLLALAGNFLLLKSALSLGAGETLVLAATLLWSIEYALSKKALEKLSTGTVALARMGIGSLLLFAFLAFTGRAEQIASLSSLHWEWVLISGGFLFFFVSLWYDALKWAPLTQAAAALTLGGPITAALSLAFAGKALAPSEALGMLLLTAGIAVMLGYSNLAEAFRFARRFFNPRAFSWKAE